LESPFSNVNQQNTASEDFSALIVAVANNGDRKAFARLFEHYAPRLKSFLLRQGAEGALAEDLAQETMMTVWRKAVMFDPAKASAGTWIYTIARNLRIDAIRKARRPEFDPNDPAFVPDAERPADEMMGAAQMGVRVREALAELPEEQATVVRMSFFDDKAHAEIAEQLSLPLGTVKSRLRLAMRRIRAFLGEQE
jgi:RNA polymerase sigma-70 factor (ECF subfamily)